MVSASDFTKTCNYNILSDFCTPETCCLKQGQLEYIPSLAGNAIYAAFFAIIILPNLWLGIRSKTWSFMTWLVLGLIGELVGYIGRIQLYNNIFDFNAFLTYLIPLTIAPAFITASIYLCLARIIYIVDPSLQYTRLKPMTYTKIFVTIDIICLVLQGAGGGLAATAKTHSAGQTGVNVMIAGLAFQVISLVLFSIICLDFAWRLRNGTTASQAWGSRKSAIAYEKSSAAATSTGVEPSNTLLNLDSIRRTKMFQGFCWSIGIATTLIFVRSSYRLAELKDGFGSALFNDQTLFMIFEGPMIIIACAMLTVFHPSLSMRGFWKLDVVMGEKVTSATDGEGWMRRGLKVVGIGKK